MRLLLRVFFTSQHERKKSDDDKRRYILLLLLVGGGGVFRSCGVYTINAKKKSFEGGILVCV